jgi:hypothetical protein
MRQLGAVLCGVACSFVAVALATFLALRFDGGAFRHFALGEFPAEQFFAAAERATVFIVAVILPAGALVAGLFTSLLAKNTPYLLSAISVLPLLTVFVLLTGWSGGYAVLASLGIALSAAIGAAVGTFIRRKRLPG